LIDQVGTTGKQRAELQALLDRETEEKKILNDQSRALNAKLHVSICSRFFVLYCFLLCRSVLDAKILLLVRAWNDSSFLYLTRTY